MTQPSPSAAASDTATRPLALAILQALAEQGAHAPQSLPRLAKRLGSSASALLRELALLGDAPVAGHAGPGWVRVTQRDGHWQVALTAEGAAVMRIGLLLK